MNPSLRSLRVLGALLCVLSVRSPGESAVPDSGPAPAAGGLFYIHPLPGSSMVSAQTNIAVRPAPAAADPAFFSVVGSRSGLHPGRTLLSDDSRTILFQPDEPFAPGETVTVRAGVERFSFEVSNRSGAPPEELLRLRALSDPGVPEAGQPAPSEAAPLQRTGALPPLPSDYPAVDIKFSSSPDSGLIFLNNWGGTPYIMILDNTGAPRFYRRMPSRARDFKVQPSGKLTYRLAEPFDKFYCMDSTYAVIDSFVCQNGYGTDEHDCQMLADGHVLLIGMDYQSVDMSKLVQGGNPAAWVLGAIVQELDTQHNVVFQWRSWDHFRITDAEHVDLRASSIDYVHMNAVAVDNDGNLLFSSRHLSEITKVDRSTGRMLWRLGGKNNQFTFPNDAGGFTYQHDIRALPGGTYTLFDNGNYHAPAYSRAVEYRLDTAAHTATLVWQYRHVPDYYTWWMGNVQRLPSGNTLIGWADGSLPKITEVRPDGSRAFELDFHVPAHCYRVFRFPWQGKARAPYLDVETDQSGVRLLYPRFGDQGVKKYMIYGGTTPKPTARIDSSTLPYTTLTKLPPLVRYYLRVTAVDSAGRESGFSNEESVVVRQVQPGENMVINGDFSRGMSFWTLTNTDGATATAFLTVDSVYFLVVQQPGPQIWSVQLCQTGLEIRSGKKYVFAFDAYASTARLIDAKVEQAASPYANYSQSSTVSLTTTRKHFSYPFTMTATTDLDARISFNCGARSGNIFLDNVSVREVMPASAGETPSVPGPAALLPCYPNPFNPATMLTFQLPEAVRVRLSVVDLLGREAALLVDGPMQAGMHSIRFDGAGLASGVYIARLFVEASASGREAPNPAAGAGAQRGGTVLTRSMILLR